MAKPEAMDMDKAFVAIVLMSAAGAICLLLVSWFVVRQLGIC